MDEVFVKFVVGVIVAVVLWWTPWLGAKWDAYGGRWTKRFTLLGLFVAVPVAFALLSCFVKVPYVYATCGADPLAAVGTAAWLGISALAGSQGGWLVLLKWGAELKHDYGVPKTLQFPPTKIIEVIPPGSTGQLDPDSG